LLEIARFFGNIGVALDADDGGGARDDEIRAAAVQCPARRSRYLKFAFVVSRPCLEICRSSITICSALNLFFGMTILLSKLVSIKSLGTKRASQVRGSKDRQGAATARV
jgi:hypothetical protein